jgi:hypothetical protein
MKERKLKVITIIIIIIIVKSEVENIDLFFMINKIL